MPEPQSTAVQHFQRVRNRGKDSTVQTVLVIQNATRNVNCPLASYVLDSYILEHNILHSREAHLVAKREWNLSRYTQHPAVCGAAGRGVVCGLVTATSGAGVLHPPICQKSMKQAPPDFLLFERGTTPHPFYTNGLHTFYQDKKRKGSTFTGVSGLERENRLDTSWTP